ncbi:hypothetical protein Q9L58_004642 [Maublancomyces gigas]|uniref:HNH nuclease domain-containing protein n=1 Tax=Discina gigas TaxID=1032678 RepID=A0ABR3GKD7_9PEZI
MSSALGKRTNPNVDENTYPYYHLLKDKIKAAPRSDKKTIVTKTLAAAYGVCGYEQVTEYMITELLGGKSIASAAAGLKQITDADAVTRCSALIVKEFLSPSVYLPPLFVIALTAIVAGGKSPGGAPPSRLTSFGTQVTARDDYTCRVTDRVDRQKYAKIGFANLGNTKLGRLERAHIAPWAALSNKTVASFVQKFTGGVIDKRALATVDTVENGMLLQHDAHRDYDDYLWSVKEVDGKYMVITRNYGPKLSFACGNRELKFENLPGRIYGKPDARFFQLHRVVGQLLQDTGLGGAALMQGV